MSKKKKNNVPKLRFPGFEGDWKDDKIEGLAEVSSGGTPNRRKPEYWNGDIPWITTSLVDFNQIKNAEEHITKEGLDNSSAKIFPKGTMLMAMYGQGVTRGKVGILKLDAATNQACAAIKWNKKIDTQLMFFQLQRIYEDIRNISNSGGQKNLSAGLIKRIRLSYPPIAEQKKIASFLTIVDSKLRQLRRKKALLEEYKKGVMQQLFSREIRFKDEEGKEFPEWEKRLFSEILFEHGKKSTGKEEVFSVSVHKGLVNQIKHLGRSFAAKNTDHYNLVKPHDIVYTKSPTGNFPYGIIKQSRVDKNVIVSPLYGIFTPETPALGYILNEYFLSNINTHNYLHSIIQKGAKNTININNKTFLSKSLNLPVSKIEQQKIATFLTALDEKIAQVGQQVEKMEEWKKGLLQQLFV